MRIRRVFFFFQIATRDVNHREMSIPRIFRVPDNLDGDVLSRFVIQRSDHLTKASLANYLQDLVSECIHKFRIIYICASKRHLDNVDVGKAKRRARSQLPIPFDRVDRSRAEKIRRRAFFT